MGNLLLSENSVPAHPDISKENECLHLFQLRKKRLKIKSMTFYFLRSSILLAGSGPERTDNVNIAQHAVFEEVNIGVIDKVPTRNTTNTNTCVFSSCCVKCYYKLKPFSMSLCFNLRVKNIFFF